MAPTGVIVYNAVAEDAVADFRNSEGPLWEIRAIILFSFKMCVCVCVCGDSYTWAYKHFI